MAEKKCPSCASRVPVEASVCAHCRSKLPRVGFGWWEASDGLMYPPHAHPDFPNNMPKLPPRPPMSTSRKVLWGVVAAVGIAVVVGAAVTPAEESDVLAEEACEEFGDLRDADLYTDAELRTQVQQIWREAQYAENSAVRSAARRLLSAVTLGDVEGYVDAAADLGLACRSL